MLKKLLEAKKKVREAMSRINDGELQGIRNEVRTYQRPAISTGNVKGPCDEIELWENGITQRIDNWADRKKRELGETDGYLASSVRHEVLSKLHRDSRRYLESVVGKKRK